VNKDEREGAACMGVLSEEIVKKIRNAAEKNNTTRFTVIFSLYILLLSRFANQEDISCSIINAGRDYEGLIDIVGFFVNAVLFRTRVEYDERFNDFLQRVHTEVLEVSQHQAYPLERVCEDLKMRYPDIPVSFNMLNIGDTDKREKPGMDESPHIPDISDIKFDIELYIVEYKNTIDIIWTYRKNMFHRDSIDFLMKDYIELVEFFSRNPGESYKAYKLSKRKESIWE
jgi:fengycin family lipopeptide synthetase D